MLSNDDVIKEEATAFWPSRGGSSLKEEVPLVSDKETVLELPKSQSDVRKSSPKKKKKPIMRNIEL